jgi:hypothetical protein
MYLGPIMNTFPPRVLPIVSKKLKRNPIIVMNHAIFLVILGRPDPLKKTAGNIINVLKNIRNTAIALGAMILNN